MTSRTYSVMQFWSPILGQDAARVSMGDGRTGEFFMIIPDNGGREYRKAVERAVENITAAIDQGLPPGRVVVHESEAA